MKTLEQPKYTETEMRQVCSQARRWKRTQLLLQASDLLDDMASGKKSKLQDECLQWLADIYVTLAK